MIVERAISLTQPWATLMASGAKKIETRCWRTGYRGWVAIHAAKSFPSNCRTTCFQQPFASALLDAGVEVLDYMPRGQIIAVVNLLDCIRVDFVRGQIKPPESNFGDYSNGRYAFMTEGARRLRDPFFTKGSLGIWHLFPPVTEDQLL